MFGRSGSLAAGPIEFAIAVLGQDIKDTGCSVRIFRRDVALRLPLFHGSHRFFGPLLLREGCRLVQVPVTHRPRPHGTSHYNIWNRSLKVIVDLLGVAWLMRRPIRYEVTPESAVPRAIYTRSVANHVASGGLSRCRPLISVSVLAQSVCPTCGHISTNSSFWLAIGFLGQAIFTARFLAQWLASEKKKDSVVPVIFWWLSLAGGLTLLSYAVYTRDPVIIVGQSLGVFIYVRNLMLVGKARRRAETAGNEIRHALPNMSRGSFAEEFDEESPSRVLTLSPDPRYDSFAD